MSSVFLAKSDAEIARCFAVMHELRPHLTAEDFVERVRRQASQGFQMAAVEEAGEVVSAAGFRMAESLAWGRFLYVDDLVTADKHRSKGYGGVLFDWLLDYARRHGRDQFHLDSGVHRFGAHRFYLERRMRIGSHHFDIVLEAE